jgi:hypothetical protein
MATEVIHEQSSSTSGSGMGFLMGIILLIVLAFLLFYYGLPALRGGAGSGGGVNVPSRIDVNMNQPAK